MTMRGVTGKKTLESSDWNTSPAFELETVFQERVHLKVFVKTPIISTETKTNHTISRNIMSNHKTNQIKATKHPARSSIPHPTSPSPFGLIDVVLFCSDCGKMGPILWRNQDWQRNPSKNSDWQLTRLGAALLSRSAPVWASQSC